MFYSNIYLTDIEADNHAPPKYVNMVANIAKRVPLGMAVPGSFKSPDMFAPAIIPVVAGKNTAKTEKKSSFRNSGTKLSLNVDIEYPVMPRACFHKGGGMNVPTI